MDIRFYLQLEENLFLPEEPVLINQSLETCAIVKGLIDSPGSDVYLLGWTIDDALQSYTMFLEVVELADLYEEEHAVKPYSVISLKAYAAGDEHAIPVLTTEIYKLLAEQPNDAA